MRIDLVTDMADEVVLHWGLCKPGSKEWTVPAEKLWPEESEVGERACPPRSLFYHSFITLLSLLDPQVGGPSAVDTRMLNCDDDECDVEISGAKVRLILQ